MLVALALFVARDAPAHVLRGAGVYLEYAFSVRAPQARIASWALALPPVEVSSVVSREGAPVRLYADDGEIDESARATLERIAANDAPPHILASRVEQLLVRASYHFGAAPIQLVSTWRNRASRHGTGEAIDFKLKGVHPRDLAAYLRQLPRAGVGIYTNPHTQFVHLDVRDQSYHWVDASPPGVKWHEAPLRDPAAAKRDAAWTPDSDLPL
jgi:Peptidase M15